ncbi:hypothetical protein [Vogesella indigofera]|uniref:hypothetical protein n=1 Tax=Vogesella indigofera TaxID=45465 RepID=UPI00234E3E15|nr:hypothetical protein [Vogesella indigofera]MDC7709092.1 hypothetical protein [Vogesella indigofera]MDC7711512.1 hypothetical protein [Vogesella indigofera]
MTTPANYFDALASKAAALQAGGADLADCQNLQSDADDLRADVVHSLQVLGSLMSNHGYATVGDEAALFPKVGSMVRVLGDLLDYANRLDIAASNTAMTHGQSATAGQAASYQTH